MATRKRKDVESSLSQKGFTLQDGKDYRYYFFMFNDRLVARTKVSTGKKYKDLGNDLVSSMARQCHLVKDDSYYNAEQDIGEMSRLADGSERDRDGIVAVGGIVRQNT